MAWHKGTWWPLFVKEWYGPRCSQHMFDPYSFCLLVLGLVLHLLWGTDNIGNWIFGFVAAVLVELVWELIGNSNFILKRIKNNSGTSGEYNGKLAGNEISEIHLFVTPGDSIQNILGDILSCAIGYIVGTLFAAVELWWLSLVWVVISEVSPLTLLKRGSVYVAGLDYLHPLHARQSGAGRPHPAGPQPEAQAVAVRQDPEGGREIFLLSAVLVVSSGQDLLGRILQAQKLLSKYGTLLVNINKHSESES